MSAAFKGLERLWRSPVVWSWAFNLLRLASGIVLLPLLTRYLSKADLGMYINFTYFGILVGVMDSMFSLGISRNIGYAMRGVKELRPLGIAPDGADGVPNVPLLSNLLHATRRIYFKTSCFVFAVLGVAGTTLVYATSEETSNPGATWLAWTIVWIAAPLELYTGCYAAFIRGMDHVLLGTRIVTAAFTLKLVVGCVLILAEMGLLAVPIATLLSSLLQRVLAQRFCKLVLPTGVGEEVGGEAANLVKVLWPTSWRFGLQLMSSFLAVTSFLMLASTQKGLAATSQYSLSMVVVFQICQGMASVWTSVKWPLVNQLRATRDVAKLRQTLRPRVWMQLLTFVILVECVVAAGPWLLEWWSKDKELLPRTWLLVLALYTLLEMQANIWTTLLSTENRIPSLWPTVWTNVGSIALGVCLFQFTPWKLEALVLAPLVSGLAFNYWYWAYVGPRSLETTWWRFMTGADAKQGA